jgi:hypothetical protein
MSTVIGNRRTYDKLSVYRYKNQAIRGTWSSFVNQQITNVVFAQERAGRRVPFTDITVLMNESIASILLSNTIYQLSDMIHTGRNIYWII